MMQENTVLLARPHPFIVERMTEFLARNRYATRSVADGEDVPDGAVKGVVISTSVAATSWRVGQTFRKVRERLPDVPILFATLMQPEQALAALKAELAGMVDDPVFVTLDGPPAAHAGLGAANVFLVVHKDQVACPEALARAGWLVSRHFH